MGKISNYARVLKAKLQDVFAIDSTDSNVTTTKSVTVEQIGDAICGEQVHATLETEQQTIIDGINEVNDKADDNATAIGDLSQLTTTDKSSLVGAVNSINRIDTKSITISITCRGYIRCYQMGKIVFVDININTDGNTTPVNTTIATGFPKPYESFYPRLLARDNNGTYAQVLNFDKNNGTIKTADTVMQGNTWWGCQFTYFTND